MPTPTLITWVWAACVAASTAAAWAAGGESSTSVLKAESGLFGTSEAGTQTFVATRALPLKDGQAFGWRIQLRTQATTVRVREELTLPAEPKTWGDPEPGLKRRTTPDGRTAVTELQLAPRNGFISQSWTVTTGDPKGTWVIKVRVEDGPEHVFRFDAR
jgi:hypothetical protein